MTWAGGCRALGWEGGARARLRDTGTRRGGETSVCRGHGGRRPLHQTKSVLPPHSHPHPEQVSRRGRRENQVQRHLPGVG